MLWNSALVTGIPKIDEQHKELCHQIDILRDRSKGDSIPQVLDFLGKYVIKHFSDEQVMHATSKYPKAATHKEIHAKFIADLRSLRKQYEASGRNLEIVMKINNVLGTWLKNHIMVHDKEFAVYYNSLKP